MVIVQLFEHIKAKFNVCCAEGIHFMASTTWEQKRKQLRILLADIDNTWTLVITFQELKSLSTLLQKLENAREGNSQ